MDTTSYLKLLPASLLARIFALACTDGGYTGSSLSRVSKSVRQMSSMTRFHSVSLSSGSVRQIKKFLSVFIAQRDLDIPCKPGVAHLYLLSPFSKIGSGSARSARAEAKFTRLVASLTHLVARELETLCLVQCADTSNLWDFLLPLPPSPAKNIIFPKLRELMLVGSGVAHHNVVDDLDWDAVEVFPRLSHLQLVATTMEILRWSSLAPNLARMRVTDRDPYGAQQVMRTTFMQATRNVLGWAPVSPSHPHSPETFYMVMDEEPVRVLRYSEPRVVQAESDWEELMKREWLERIGGGPGCWSVVAPMR